MTLFRKRSEPEAPAESGGPFALPPKFFKFDFKDTMRVLVWIVISAFSLGGLWAQRRSDLERIDSEARAHDAAIAEIRVRVSKLDDSMTKRLEIDAAVAANLEGIRTELRYTNEKIDVLRADIRGQSGAKRGQ